MNHTKVAIALVFLGLVGLLGYKYFLTKTDDLNQLSASDAKAIKGSLRIGVDNWVGYLPLCSKELRRRMRQSGYLLECVDDNADYDQRMKQLKRGKLDLAVATVDSYLLSGAKYNYPGMIMAVIDQSKGGDAIVAWENQVGTIDGLKQQPKLKIAFTPDSPSEHLLKALSSHFDVPHLRQARGDWRVETDGSTAALDQLLSEQVSAAVLWEPDVSKAMANDGIIKMLGTEDTRNLIVDILLVGRKFYGENQAVLNVLMTQYFRTLKHFKTQPDSLLDELAERDGLSKKAAKKVVGGVHWVSLRENAQQWFGISLDGSSQHEMLIDAIEDTVNILVDAGDFDRSPLPESNPYRITQSELVSNLFRTGGNVGFISSGANQGDKSVTQVFQPMNDAAWNKLREIGTLRTHPIAFQSGTDTLTESSQLELEKAARQLTHYPNFRVMILGHTGLRGDKAANKLLSLSRAESVRRHFIKTYGVNKHRVKAVGYGAEKPLHKKPEENNRAYNYRLPRVELFLVAEEM